MILNLIELILPSFGFIPNMVWGIFLTIDSIIFGLVEVAIDIFFYMTQLNMSSLGTGFQAIISRAMTLISILMLFRIAFALIQYMIDPEKLSSNSGGGGVNLIKSIMIGIAMFALIQPVDTPGGNRVGLIFGLLDDIQALIVGVPDIVETTGENGDSTQTTHKYNYIQNLAPIEGTNEGFLARLFFGKNPAMKSFSHFLAFKFMNCFIYQDPDYTGRATTNIDQVFQVLENKKGSFKTLNSLQGYINSGVVYWFILSGLAGIYLGYLIIMSAVKVGIRVVKLMIMQVLAPIAVISYMNPESQGLFKKYIKLYFSIFIEIFMRVGLLYLACIVAGSVLDSSKAVLNSTGATGFMGLLLRALIVLAVFKSLDEIPKLFNQLFGTNLGGEKGSFAGVLGATMGFAVGGITGLTSGVSRGAGGFGTAMNALAGAGSGLVGGASAKNFGETISKSVATAGKNRTRAEGMAAAGGGLAFIGGSLLNATGSQRRQDYKIQEKQGEADASKKMTEFYESIDKEAEQQVFKDKETDLKKNYASSHNLRDANGNLDLDAIPDGVKEGFKIKSMDDYLKHDSNYITAQKDLEYAQATLSHTPNATNQAAVEAAKTAKETAINAAKADVGVKKNAVVTAAVGSAESSAETSKLNKTAKIVRQANSYSRSNLKSKGTLTTANGADPISDKKKFSKEFKDRATSLETEISDKKSTKIYGMTHNRGTKDK